MKAVAVMVLGFALCSSLALADPDPGWWSYFGTGGGQYGLGARGRDLIEFDGYLIVGGDFEHCFNGGPNSYDLRRIGRFDGASWGRIADGFDDDVWALLSHQGELYAVGSFDAAGLTPMKGIARWDGWSWNAVGNGFHGGLQELSTYQGDLVVWPSSSIGGFSRWDGQAWVDLMPFDQNLGNGLVQAMAEFDGDLYVGGQIEVAEGIPVTHLVRWDGAHWSDFGTSLVPSAFNWGAFPVEVLSTEFDGDLLVGGAFSEVNGVFANGLAKWDGESWTGLGDGLGSSAAVTGVTVYNGELVVVGGFTMPDGGQSVARWDGSSWHSFGSGLTLESPFDARLSAQAYESELYITGNFYGAGGKFSSCIARWNESGTGVPILGLGGSELDLRIVGANPTASGVDCAFSLPNGGSCDLSVFDLAGRRVATLLRRHCDPGVSTAQWDGREQSGRSVSAGVYFLRLENRGLSSAKKIVVHR